MYDGKGENNSRIMLVSQDVYLTKEKRSTIFIDSTLRLQGNQWNHAQPIITGRTKEKKNGLSKPS